MTNFKKDLYKINLSPSQKLTDKIIRGILAGRPSPTVLMKRHLSTSTDKKDNKLVEDTDNKFNVYSGKFKSRFITPLKAKFVSYLAYKPDHYTFDIETYRKKW